MPALYLAGDRDLVLASLGLRSGCSARDHAPRLREPVMLSDCGHWTQQERPDEVSDAMISFIRDLGPPD